jgi:hypothetical protein
VRTRVDDDGARRGGGGGDSRQKSLRFAPLLLLSIALLLFAFIIKPLPALA